MWRKELYFLWCVSGKMKTRLVEYHIISAFLSSCVQRFNRISTNNMKIDDLQILYYKCLHTTYMRYHRLVIKAFSFMWWYMMMIGLFRCSPFNLKLFCMGQYKKILYALLFSSCFKKHTKLGVNIFVPELPSHIYIKH